MACPRTTKQVDSVRQMPLCASLEFKVYVSDQQVLLQGKQMMGSERTGHAQVGQTQYLVFHTLTYP